MWRFRLRTLLRPKSCQKFSRCEPLNTDAFKVIVVRRNGESGVKSQRQNLDVVRIAPAPPLGLRDAVPIDNSRDHPDRKCGFLVASCAAYSWTSASVASAVRASVTPGMLRHGIGASTQNG